MEAARDPAELDAEEEEVATAPARSVDLVRPDAARLAGASLVLAHADGFTPPELHVHLGLRHGFGFDVVATPSRLRWRVDEERIARS